MQVFTINVLFQTLARRQTDVRGNYSRTEVRTSFLWAGELPDRVGNWLLIKYAHGNGGVEAGSISPLFYPPTVRETVQGAWLRRRVIRIQDQLLTRAGRCVRLASDGRALFFDNSKSHLVVG